MAGRVLVGDAGRAAGAVQRREVYPVVPPASGGAQLGPPGVDVKPQGVPFRGLGQSLRQRRDPPQAGAPAQSAPATSATSPGAHTSKR